MIVSTFNTVDTKEQRARILTASERRKYSQPISHYKQMTSHLALARKNGHPVGHRRRKMLVRPQEAVVAIMNMTRAMSNIHVGLVGTQELGTTLARQIVKDALEKCETFRKSSSGRTMAMALKASQKMLGRLVKEIEQMLHLQGPISGGRLHMYTSIALIQPFPAAYIHVGEQNKALMQSRILCAHGRLCNQSTYKPAYLSTTSKAPTHVGFTCSSSRQ